MLQQPRVPPTGQRQAIEVHIKWKEVLNQKQAYLAILSETTGHSVEKLDKVFQNDVDPKNAFMIVSDITAQIGLSYNP